MGNDKNPSGNYQSGSSTSSTDNQKELLITNLQHDYQDLADLRLHVATWQKRIDIRKGMSVDRALRACQATIQATMDIPKSQDRPKTAGQRLPGKMPPLPHPKADETWLAPLTKSSAPAPLTRSGKQSRPRRDYLVFCKGRYGGFKQRTPAWESIKRNMYANRHRAWFAIRNGREVSSCHLLFSPPTVSLMIFMPNASK